MAVASTPVEIWQKILRYAISCPVFFEYNVADTCSVEELNRYNHETPYWDAERRRATLRCVCGSWNSYLQGFDYRYVRLTDVVHGLVAAWRICHAIRLNLDACYCRKCRRSGTRTRDIIQNRLRILQELAEQNPQPWSIEIIQGQVSHGEDLLILVRSATNIRSIVRRHPYQVAAAISLLPNLVTFCGTTDDSALLALGPKDSLNFSSLTTFQVDLASLESCSRWQLPALRYFSFLYNSPEYSPDNTELISMLKAIGSNLRCLFYFGRPLDAPIPSELWQLCPRLERLQTPMLWGPDPPRHHPISCVRIDVEAVQAWGQQFSANSWDDAIARYFPAERLYASGILNSMLSCTWSDVFFGASSVMTKEIVLNCKELAAYVGLTFADVENVTFERYIVFLLTDFWKGRSCNKQYAFMRRPGPSPST